jgi:hypothetical protein
MTTNISLSVDPRVMRRELDCGFLPSNMLALFSSLHLAILKFFLQCVLYRRDDHLLQTNYTVVFLIGKNGMFGTFLQKNCERDCQTGNDFFCGLER